MIVGFTVFEEIRNKFNLEKYNSINIIITHLHNDHAGSLSQVILYCWFVYNKKVTVISKCKRIREYLEITGTTKEAYEITDKFEKLEFINTEHTKELDSYGVKMTIGDKNIVYTGDTRILDPFFSYIKDADEFYVDVSKSGGVHLQIDEILPVLKNIKSSGTKVILMHMDDKKYIKRAIGNEFEI